MYSDLLIIILLIIAILSIYLHHTNNDTLFSEVKKKYTQYITPKYTDEYISEHMDTGRDVIRSDARRYGVDTEILETRITDSKNEDSEDDRFLYSDHETAVLYPMTRDQEAHCACEDAIDDTYYDNGDEEFVRDDNVPISEFVDKYNELTRYNEEEQVDENFDGIYNDMYNINESCANKGSSTFNQY